MKKAIELLAPGGDIDSIKAAIAGGADAVYCGLDKFNARNRAVNLSFENLNGILRLAHKNNCKVFLTLNIIIVESELPALTGLLNKLVNTSIDGIIIQDLGLFYLLSNYFKGLKIHASTQLTTHNEGQIEFLSKLNATQVNLCREMNIQEIKALTAVGHENKTSIEVFVHGSYCLSFSGICYMSSVHGGNSGNRGRCSQPCRDQYFTTSAGNDFPLNLKDNSAWTDLRELSEAGVDSLKIEGRIKKFHYVYTVVDAWRKQLQNFYDHDLVNKDQSELYKVFNRGFSNGFLKNEIDKNMFIDNPRDNSAIRLSETYGGLSDENLDFAKGAVYDERTDIINEVEEKINRLSVAKAPLTITISGECGTPLKVSVKTPDATFEVLSEIKLKEIGAQPLNREILLTRLKALNDTEYYIEHLEMSRLRPNLFLPYKELTSIKKRLLFILNDSKESVDPIEIPALKNPNNESIPPVLSVLISSPDDLHHCEHTTATLHFQLPNCLKNDFTKLLALFKTNPKLIPWFPSVLIGEDYRAAVEFLEALQPKRIVTNNTGIACEAFKKGISWIAGPYLNIANSFSLLCLKENFNCSGAFISNELNKIQIKSIKKPENFDLYYSIYHPIVLMTSRQCLFQQVTGCKKDRIDEGCIPQCEKSSAITNLKKETFFIEKSKGNYHSLYNGTNSLNTDIVTDGQNFFSGYLIDLRDIQTETKIEVDKSRIIHLFENLLAHNPDSKERLKQSIHPTTNAQYKKGI
jgi:U32 family peptidase